MAGGMSASVAPCGCTRRQVPVSVPSSHASLEHTCERTHTHRNVDSKNVNDHIRTSTGRLYEGRKDETREYSINMIIQLM
jgi:hypothetical protein